MRGMPRAGLLALLLLSLPATSARAVDEKRVNAAVEGGVAALKRMQAGNGTWRHEKVGATALAALTLLECDVPPEDPSIKAAAKFLRESSVNLTDTYSIALAILFFDRLGDPRDVPLIESLMVRLLAGQLESGAWTYTCPNLAPEEVKRLQGVIRGGRELTTKPGEGRPTAEKKRTAEDLAPEIRRQLDMIGRVAPARGGALGLNGDNSNTQFAVLALWVGRRYGLPIDAALTRLDVYFRAQQNTDGGWCYRSRSGASAEPSTPAMTCAGLLGLAVAHGLAEEIIEERRKDAEPKGDRKKPPRLRKIDVEKDPAMQVGMAALSTWVGLPGGGLIYRDSSWGPYYFLWSLERVAVGLDLKTVGGKDWYGWGAEIILATQRRDGTWLGAGGRGPVILMGCGETADTCFALLFLKRSNLATDLTTRLGKKTRHLAKELRSGGVGGAALKGGAPLPPPGPDPGKPATPAPAPEDSEAARLAGEVLEAPADRRGELLDKLSGTPGAENTQALREVIARAEEEVRQKARQALAARFAHLKPSTLTAYLKHEDDEYRQAAALALGMKEAREQVPELIRALSDTEPAVVAAARASLKAITRKDFGPDPGADDAERGKAIAQWELWWASNRGS